MLKLERQTFSSSSQLVGEVKVFVNINTVSMLTCVSGILDSSNRCVTGLRDILEVTDSMVQNTRTLNHVSHTVM